MRLRTLLLAGCFSIATTAVAASTTKKSCECCEHGTPTAASYKWDFKGEANAIFSDIRADAEQASEHADQLAGFTRNDQIDWEEHAEQLDGLKADVNDMGTKVCRLETIRRVVAPWQQAEIDRIAADVRLLADSTEDAIRFGDTHSRELWLPTYQKYVNNMFDLSGKLEHSAATAVAYANASKEVHNLRHELGMPAPAAAAGDN